MISLNLDVTKNFCVLYLRSEDITKNFLRIPSAIAPAQNANYFSNVGYYLGTVSSFVKKGGRVAIADENGYKADFEPILNGWFFKFKQACGFHVA